LSGVLVSVWTGAGAALGAAAEIGAIGAGALVHPASNEQNASLRNIVSNDKTKATHSQCCRYRGTGQKLNQS